MSFPVKGNKRVQQILLLGISIFLIVSFYFYNSHLITKDIVIIGIIGPAITLFGVGISRFFKYISIGIFLAVLFFIIVAAISIYLYAPHE